MSQSADWTLGELSEVFTEQNIKFLVRQFHLSWFFFFFFYKHFVMQRWIDRNTFLVMVFFVSSQIQSLCDDSAQNKVQDPTGTQFIIITCYHYSFRARKTLWTGHQTLREWTHSPTVWIDNLKSTLPFVCREMRYVCCSNTRNCTCCSPKAPFKPMYILSTLTLNATLARLLCWAVCEL